MPWMMRNRVWVEVSWQPCSDLNAHSNTSTIATPTPKAIPCVASANVLHQVIAFINVMQYLHAWQMQ